MEQKVQPKAKRVAEGNKRKWENNNSNQGGNHNNNNRNNNYGNNKRGSYRDNNYHNQYNNRRQGSARALIAAQNDGVDQGGPAPNCNRCGLCHFGNCPSKCSKCGKIGHKTKDYRGIWVAAGVNTQPIRACYECGDKSHNRSQCPNQNNQQGGNAIGRAYAIRDAEQGQRPNVVMSTFLINSSYARVLFDSGSDKSFVNSSFSHLIDIKSVRLNTSYEVELADGKTVSTNTVLRGCTLNLVNHLFEIDLMPIELGAFEVIIGMDWLVERDAVIVCGKKVVHILIKNNMLVVK
ncbi:putative reverse transcriptase domain-containing protein, partial [Tanacetum coccineum]